MELEENNTPEVQDDDAVEIYSGRAIFWFFFLAGPLFGGALLMINLNAAGFKKAINWIFGYVILFNFANIYLFSFLVKFYKIDLAAYQAKLMSYKQGDNLFDSKIMILMGADVAFKLIGALILSQYFFKRYFPEKDYYPKSIATPLFIAIAVTLLLMVLGMGGL